ncbi:hypothetical protein [Tahibacter aquaticus]|uniref:hypothetical protein n=1 Tax=Tahibacter aquaticus TaxID=520092 RepID=UPI00105E7BF1|nr:hypothetical protein [Tahibacter aquaticus]
MSTTANRVLFFIDHVFLIVDDVGPYLIGGAYLGFGVATLTGGTLLVTMAGVLAGGGVWHLNRNARKINDASRIGDSSHTSC